MSLPCLGWFDDCDNVIQMLEKIRNARINSKTIKINGQKNIEEYTLVANSVKIAGTDYKKIRLIYKPEKEDYNLDPTKYDSYFQQFLVANGSSDEQKGFVYYKGTTPLFKIVVDDDTSKIGRLKEYLYGKGGTYESISKIFNNKTVLTPTEIKDVREQIESLKNEEQKKELYLKLQEKVKYVNQRTNTSEEYNTVKGESEKIGDVMCQLTCLSRCLEYLGISNPSNTLSFPDYLEKVHKDKFNSYERESHELWIKIANEFDVEGKYIPGVDIKTNLNKSELTKILLPKLNNGYAVILSIKRSDGTSGHIVRLQSVTDKGLIVDDSYGKEDPLKRWNYPTDKLSYWIEYNSTSDSGSSVGDNNLWEWDKIEKINIATAIYFKNK